MREGKGASNFPKSLPKSKKGKLSGFFSIFGKYEIHKRGEIVGMRCNEIFFYIKRNGGVFPLPGAARMRV